MSNMMRVKPQTNNQNKFFSAYKDRNNSVIVGYGSTGSGKTFLAMYLALNDLYEQQVGQIVIIRSAVPSRDIGFLPGELESKASVYEEPYIMLCEEITGNWKYYEDLKDKGRLHFGLTSFCRGISFDNSIIIVDECQNMSYRELSTIITRVGINSRIMFTGDIQQSDMWKKHDQSGWPMFLKVLQRMKVPVIEFGVEDIVRSGVVKKFILAEMAEGVYR